MKIRLRLLLAGVLLVGCEKQASTPSSPRSATSPAVSPVQMAAEVKEIPGFTLNLETQTTNWPDAATLLAHWDEIQRRIRAQPRGTRRDGLMAAAIQQLVEGDPKRAAEALAAWKDATPSLWARAAGNVVKALWRQDQGAAAVILRDSVPRAQQGGLWLEVLAPTPPEQAAKWLDAMPPGDSKSNAAAVILSRWLKRNPEAAAAWLDKFGAGLPLSEVEKIFHPNYGYSDTQDDVGAPDPMEAARRAFEAAKLPAARRFFAESYLREVEAAQPGQLTEITTVVEKELASSDATALMTEAALKQMRADPAAYLADLAPEQIKQLPPDFTREAISSWASKETPTATRWAVAQGRPEETAQCVDSWYRLDPPAVIQFALALPPGLVRDRGLEKLCDRLSWDQDFATAEKCRALIEDKDLAQSAAFRISEGKKRQEQRK